MKVTLCDKCKQPLIVGFICREDYFSDNLQGRTQWLMSQSHEDKTKHICYICMDEIIKKEICPQK